MMHLDTHVVVWLYEGRVERIPARLRRDMGLRRPLVSPMVRLELALLAEMGRIREPPGVILDALRVHADLGPALSSFDRVAAIAATLPWTRDPFDRMIAAHAMADDLPLVTADTAIRRQCALARWEEGLG